LLLADDTSANPQVRCVASAFVGDEADAVTVLLHQLAVAREYLATRFQCAAEIAVVPGPGAADCAAEGAAADGARWADGQADAQTGEAFAAHEIDESPSVCDAAVVARYRRRSHQGEKEN
jgi:hypothetical protein